jgi:thioredoxin-like negative regulator of GroEL
MSSQSSRRRFLGFSATALSLSIAGCASEQGSSGQPDEPEQTPSWQDKVNSWLDNHESKEKEALGHFNDGTDAYQSEDYSRAYMHFQKARKRYEDLHKAADSKADEYDEGTNPRESFLLLTQYYWRMMQASAARENAAFAMPDDPTEANTQLGRASDHLEVANQRKEKFRDKLNYETTTGG